MHELCRNLAMTCTVLGKSREYNDTDTDTNHTCMSPNEKQIEKLWSKQSIKSFQKTPNVSKKDANISMLAFLASSKSTPTVAYHPSYAENIQFSKSNWFWNEWNIKRWLGPQKSSNLLTNTFFLSIRVNLQTNWKLQNHWFCIWNDGIVFH